MRLSVEITPQQQQRLKVSTARQGQSIKDYVLKRNRRLTEADYPQPDKKNLDKVRLPSRQNWL